MTTAAIALEMIYEDEPFVDRIERIAETGFEAIEFATWPDKDLDAIEARLAEHDLTLANMGGIREQAAPEELERAMTNPDTREAAIEDVEMSLEVANRLDCPALTVHLGPSRDAPDEEMYESVVDGLREIALAAEAAGVTLLLEPLNQAVDHAGYYLTQSERAYEIVDDVDSPALGVLFDIYHQQITEGNIIANLRRNIEYIDHVHVADVPGRHEPGTGELNYVNILDALDQVGYDGYVGFEFIPEREPRVALERIAELLA